MIEAVKLACRLHGVRFAPNGEQPFVQKGDRRVVLNRNAWIHAPHAARHFDVYFGGVNHIVSNGIKIVDYSKPRLHTFANGLEFEFSGLAEGVSSIDSYFRWHTPAAGDLVFDLGGNCGLASWRLSQLVGEGRVVCLEPDPLNFDLLQRNINRHALQNVTVLQCAAGGYCGPISFASEGAIYSQMQKFLTRESSGKLLTVDCRSFQSLCEEFGVPSFVKVDIEGAELEMLEAALPVIKDHKIHFALDTQHKVDGRFTSRRVEEFFASIGYEAATENDGMFTTTYARPKVV